MQRGDAIDNRHIVFRDGLCRVLMREVHSEGSSVQESYESVVNWGSGVGGRCGVTLTLLTYVRS
jgi:hypothetical protein